jgi:hypothetical protein
MYNFGFLSMLSLGGNFFQHIESFDLKFIVLQLLAVASFAIICNLKVKCHWFHVNSFLSSASSL